MPEVKQGQRLEVASYEAVDIIHEIAEAPDVERITLERTDGRELAEVWLVEGRQRFADLDAVVRNAATLVDTVVITVERSGERAAEDIGRAHTAPVDDPQRDESVTRPQAGEPPLKGSGPPQRQFEEGSGRRR